MEGIRDELVKKILVCVLTVSVLLGSCSIAIWAECGFAPSSHAWILKAKNLQLIAKWVSLLIFWGRWKTNEKE